MQPWAILMGQFFYGKTPKQVHLYHLGYLDKAALSDL